MSLYKLFSYNVEIQYKGSLLSKAMLFSITTTLLNIILPFIIAYRSRGFWLKSHHFYEQPVVRSTYNYLLVAETDDPSVTITCGDARALRIEAHKYEEYCAETQIQEHDYNGDDKHDRIDFKFYISIPPKRTIVSFMLILEMDYQFMYTCPLQMKTFAVVNKEFAFPPSGFQYHGELKFHQLTHLPCQRNVINTGYNISIFDHTSEDFDGNVVDFFVKSFLERDVRTNIKTAFIRTSIGHTGTFTINIYLRIPETKVLYVPSLLQELKWAWPQYLSLAFIFYWLLARVKKFVFNNRLFMSWKIVPWKKKN